MVFDGVFRWMAGFHVRHYRAFAAFIIFCTLFQVAGIPRIYLETDFSKMMPQDNPAIMLQNRVSETFSGQDIVFLLVRLDDDSTSDNRVRDIRDPRVINMLLSLSGELEGVSGVDSVQSAALVFEGAAAPSDTESVARVLDSIPQAAGLFNRDYSATTVMIRSNVGTGKEKIASLMQEINRDVEDAAKPPGVMITPTGMPTLRVLIAELLINDAVKTILLSSAIILVLLIVVQKSLIQGYLVFNPLVFALIWTLGTMGWLNIPMSLPTAGIGAMILGLGVEYSIFFVSRYKEERGKGEGQENSIYTSLSEVGTAIIGSSTTTMIGFLALLFSIMPMMHQLGQTLALGIFFCVISSLVINPSFIIFEEEVAGRLLRQAVCNGDGGENR